MTKWWNLALRGLMALAVVTAALTYAPPPRPAQAAQNSCTMPTVSPVSGLTLVNDINACYTSIITQFSGASAPSSPSTYQLWADTTTNTIKLYNGSGWVVLGSFANSTWVPASGGALETAVTTTGSANAYVLTYSPGITALVTGQTYTGITNFANTGAATLNINGTGAKNITKNGTTALASGDLANSQAFVVAWDGTEFQLVSPLAVVASTNSISNSMLAQMATNTTKCNNTGGTANAADCTVSQENTMLGTAVLGVTNTFTATQEGPTCTLTDASSIAWAANTCQVATVTLGGNRTLANPTSPVTGATYILKIIQDGTGTRTLAYGANFAWPGGTAPTLTTTASHYDIETFYYDGTKMNGVWQGNFQ